MSAVYHDSHDIKYRRPFGAAVTGSTVKLSLTASVGSKCFVRLWENGKGETVIPMSYDGGSLYSSDVSMPDHAVLIWYYFIIDEPDKGHVYYGSDGANLGGIGAVYDHEPPSWQITVYRPDHIPGWYKSAVVYQIFPDRFRRGKDWRICQQNAALSPAHRGPGRYVRDDWDEMPFYSKNPDGSISSWDFYGGNLTGIAEKLPYLKSLGVTALYLNPIFKSPSNHKYDTSDYMHVDEAFGGDEALDMLISEAGKLGINVILDGVFSHTGADSIYFNKYGNFDSVGAYQGESSPYYRWYNFEEFPDKYDCWWGVGDLPNVNEDDKWYSHFIYGGENSVIRHYISCGVKGFRLDVADELPDDFIKGIRRAMTETDSDSLLLGEVWEDASNKFSHGEQREYLYGGELQSVMNYPFRDAAVEFIMGGSAKDFRRRLMSLYENYPPEQFYANLNLIGTHDTRRIITVLGEAPELESPEGKRDFRLSAGAYELAKRRLILLSLIQFTIPGVPCIYYGDEAGMQGYEDPFNRAGFPWGREDTQLVEHFRFISHLRHEYGVLIDGDFTPLAFGRNVFGCLRRKADEAVLTLVNADRYSSAAICIERYGRDALDLLHTRRIDTAGDNIDVTLEPLSPAVIYFTDSPLPQKPLNRSAGILCHVTSVPTVSDSPVLGRDMLKFIDFLAASGQKLWQILPLSPPDAFGSPYTSCSAFAGNTALIDGSMPVSDSGYERFCNENRYWLDDFALYTILHNRFNRPWQEWPREYRDRAGLGDIKREFSDDIERVKHEQYRFFSQWSAVKRYANEHSIEIIGDIPLFVSADSADVWAHREFFMLDNSGHPLLTAGAPPDGFSADGQNWNTPVYNWDEIKRSSYIWWKNRLVHCMKLYDRVRIDHFRGLSAGYAIKNGEAAKDGEWMFGPGLDFFKSVYSADMRLIAEDLGVLDRSVYNLLELSGLPGMNVWQFNSGEMMSMDKDTASRRVFYSGTHDNDTLLGWCSASFSGNDPAERAREIIESLYASAGGWVILPLQDVFLLGSSARMNTPGTSSGNWKWKADPSLPYNAAAEYLSNLVKKYGR